MIALVRAWWALVAYSLRRQVFSRKVLLAALILAVVGAVTIASGFQWGLTPKSFGQWVVLAFLGLFFVPIVAILFGTGAIGDERDDKTLVYLLTRPLARSGLYAAKLLAVLPLALLFTIGGLWLLCQTGRLYGRPELAGTFPLFAESLVLGTTAYVALFQLMSALFRHSSLIAVAYVFFVEAFLGRIPGVMKRITVSFYTWSLAYETAAGTGIEPPPDAVFLPIDGATARIVLAAAAAGFALLGMLVFARKEYHDVG